MLVDKDCSPHGPKQFVFWNPPLSFHTLASKDRSEREKIKSQKKEEKLNMSQREWLRSQLRATNYNKLTYEELLEK